jgi:hypothetical protein
MLTYLVTWLGEKPAHTVGINRLKEQCRAAVNLDPTPYTPAGAQCLLVWLQRLA